jgi:hypothetical protein
VAAATNTQVSKDLPTMTAPATDDTPNKTAPRAIHWAHYCRTKSFQRVEESINPKIQLLKHTVKSLMRTCCPNLFNLSKSMA